MHNTGFLYGLSLLTSEVVEANVFIWNTKILAHFLNGLVHQWRTTEVQFNVFWAFVVIQVLINHTVVDEAHKAIPFCIDILLYLPVVFFQRFRQGHVKFKVREVPLQFAEVLDIEELALRTTSIPISDLTVGL